MTRVKIEYWYNVDNGCPSCVLMCHSKNDTSPWTTVDLLEYESNKEFYHKYCGVLLPNGVVNYNELSKLKMRTDIMMTVNLTSGVLTDAPANVSQWFNTVCSHPLFGYTTNTSEPTIIKQWNPYQREKLSRIGVGCVYTYSR
jgi:disulfide oxidoreductase YuzD